ncbi:uncharacterized protein JCM6883_007391 [Sporobolomyces salmoneus]|uniref:uncharacterized protein n=1 Tax=Sporobolomyces salmoneus TaxID=183962 RepID=UPI00317D3A5A
MLSLSSLPPEILCQIIESTVPHTFHTETYYERQSTLCNLCLVSRQFRAIAQPLLLEIVFTKSACELHMMLDRIAWTGSNRIPRHFSVELDKEGPGVMSVHRLPDVIPGLQSLNLVNIGEVLDIAFLSRFNNLTNLQLGWSNYKVPTSFVLSHVRTLALTDTTPGMASELLSPEILPSLRSLGFEYQYGQRNWRPPRSLLTLLPQLEVLYVPVSIWHTFGQEPRLAYTSRALIGTYITSLAVTVDSGLEATNAFVYGLGDLFLDDDGLVKQISKSIKRFLKELKKQQKIRLRVLYLDEDPRDDAELPADTQELIEELVGELLDECQQKRIEVVFARIGRLQTDVRMDPLILADFEERQTSSVRPDEEDQFEDEASLESKNEICPSLKFFVLSLISSDLLYHVQSEPRLSSLCDL